jgi:hypothetical protein
MVKYRVCFTGMRIGLECHVLCCTRDLIFQCSVLQLLGLFVGSSTCMNCLDLYYYTPTSTSIAIILKGLKYHKVFHTISLTV